MSKSLEAAAQAAYAKLPQPLQRFIYKRGWTGLNELQAAAFEPILEHKSDVVLSAATASGKTEAAFLPALTWVHAHPAPGFRIIYVSPLKALINDQYRRLADLTAGLNIPVTPWHGDVSSSRKERQLQKPEGVILITPESLESLLFNHYNFLHQACKRLAYIVIDEFHAFMGSQRGIQLVSQLHRLDNIAGRRIVRIALSATFSNIANVQPYLRPNAPQHPCVMVKPQTQRADSLALQLRGYDFGPRRSDDGQTLWMLPYKSIARDIFRLLRGSNNLVFANSRAKTEAVAGMLTEMCRAQHVPQEFFPHHGSLAKDLRESVEHRLQEGRLPTTAICTSTLELGIDIADVESIGQIDAPMTVASLRQRLGRSGRRSGRAVLRLFIPEYDIDPVDLSSQLAEETFLAAAMVELLLQRWYEPPQMEEYSFSVLLQQTLSVIASVGSASAANLWQLLCATGPFWMTDKRIFAKFLRSLAERDLIVQLGDGTLTLGREGEELCSRWHFYSTFRAADDYRIEHDHKEIGRLPLNRPPDIGTPFVFAGKAWEVTFTSRERRLIGVKPYDKSAEPLIAGEGLGFIHDESCRKMRELYLKGKCPQYFNKTAQEHFERGIAYFNHYNLAHQTVLESPAGLALFPFAGSCTIFTIIQLLRRELVHAKAAGCHIVVEYCSRENLKAAISRLLAAPPREPRELVSRISRLEENKYDEYIDRSLLELSFAHSHLHIPAALDFLKRVYSEL